MVSMVGCNAGVTYKLLRCFAEASGLKINYSKSHFDCLGKSVSWCRDAAQFLNCSTMDFPFVYLGIPVGVSSKSWIVWQPIIRKFEVKLAKWKQRSLSMGAESLSSIQSYQPYLSTFYPSLGSLKKWCTKLFPSREISFGEVTKRPARFLG